MMTSRDRVIRTLNHQPVDRAPRDLWASPAVAMLLADELADMSFRYPNDIVPPDFQYPRGKLARGTPYHKGQYTDAWGCTWHVRQQGTIGDVKAPPLADLSALDGFRPPMELLEKANLAKVNRSCASTSRFVLAWTETRPFERLQLLHGTEATLVALAEGTKPIRDLLAVLHDFSCREMEFWAASDVDGVAFRDDWGSHCSLLVSVDVWRDLFKPLYRDYCRILHQKDKFAFFHSDGDISTIFADLVHLGIDAVHSELSLMDVQRLAKRFRGRVTFWGEIDRQRVLPHGTPRQVREAVDQVRRALDFGSGGLIAQCEWHPGVPFENIAALFERWQEPMLAHA